LPGTEVRTVDAATGAALRYTDVTGALQIRGPNVFCGYWRDPEKTRSEFTADGWFKTGDLGRIDRDGYVHIVGRAKDLVISGGYNVYPKEVETELDAVPGILESAVFGVPHPDLGEGVTAVVVLQPGAAISEAKIIDSFHGGLARYGSRHSSSMNCRATPWAKVQKIFCARRTHRCTAEAMPSQRRKTRPARLSVYRSVPSKPQVVKFTSSCRLAAAPL
jgi:acyl-CoA synthetase (AMP-forming)/AMP-acid ligase II